MKGSKVTALALAVLACALSLFVIAGCGGSASSSAASSASSSASSASASSESASSVSSAASSEAASSASAASSEAASSSESASSAAVSSEAASSAADSASASSAPAEDASSAAASSQSQAASGSVDATQYFKGTVRVLSSGELLEIQETDLDASMFNDKGTYAVLIFDQPTDVTGMIADGTGPDTRTCKLLGIGEYTDYDNFVVEYGDLDQWKELDGQEIEIAATEKNIMFPTDVSLPIGEPKVSECAIVE